MFSFFTNASIKAKMAFASVVALACFVFFVYGNYIFFQEVNEKLTQLQKVDMQLVRVANDLQIELVDMNRLFEAALVEDDEDTVQEAMDYVQESLDKIELIKSLKPELTEQSQLLRKSLEAYSRDAETYSISVIDGEFRGDEMAEAFSSALERRQLYDRLVREFNSTIKNDFSTTFESLRQRAEYSTTEQIIFGVSIATFVLGFIAWLIVVTTFAMGDIVKVSSEISRGNLDVDISRKGSSEIRKLFASMAAMRDKLKEQKIESETRTRRQDQIAALNESLRGERSVKELSDSVLSCLNDQLGALVGAVYLLEEEELVMITSFAYTKRKGDTSRFKIGESLVGQAALEENIFVVRDLPDDYAPVSSGLGSSTPKEVLLVPLAFNGHLLAVMELMSFAGFNDEHLDFIKRGAEAISIALNSAVSRVQLAGALERTRQQAEAMEHQQEELRATNEELEEQTAILRSSEENLQQQQEELRVMNEELEERNRLLDRQKEEIERNNSALERSRQDLQAKAQQLELSGKYKTEFLSTMSHELRTPLNSILILSQGLMENKKDNLDNKQVEHAKVINSSGRDLLMLINDILDLSKVEEGKLELIDDNLPLEEFSSKLRGQFETQAANKHIDFKVDIDSALPQTIVVDEHRLSQILRNFISNALKFTEQGEVKVEMAIPQKSVHTVNMELTPDKTIAFHVKDTGIGIPKEKLDLIFEAFQQVDGTISRKYGGTGLGLTISRKLAEIMGGTVEVVSEGENNGSTFSLYLPLNAGKAHAASPPKMTVAPAPAPKPTPKPIAAVADAPEPTLKEKMILIVEDDLGFSGVLHSLAEEFGFHAHCAHSAGEAHKFLEQHLPGSIILDLGLPDAPGEQLLNHLKSNERTQDIPVHVISGKPNVDISKLDGAEEFIAKPFGRARLDQLFNDINAEISALPSQRVLIIEDDEVQQEQLRTSFSNQNVSCDLAKTGEEALEYLGKERYGTIVVDLQLPDAEGISLVKSLSNATSGEVPIIIYTARDLDKKQDAELRKYARRIVLKTEQSISRLLSETTLFLHWLQGQEQSSLEPEPMQEYEQADLDAHKGKRLLLVDDDIRNLYSLSAVLEESGFEITTASTGIEAIEALESDGPFDLVLMDVMMPEMDGLEATQRIRKDNRYKKLPIIALTAKAMRDDRARCIEAGANDYMSKPVDPNKLKAIVGMWLRQA